MTVLHWATISPFLLAILIPFLYKYARPIHEKGLDQPGTINVQELDNHIVPMTGPFQPREYIRIGSRIPNRAE